MQFTNQIDATVLNFPVSFEVSNFPVAFEVSNFPAVQPVSGSVSISGSVSVSNFPATQNVAGTVDVGNFPAVQPVSGPLTDTQLRAVPVPVSFASIVTHPTVSRVAVSNSAAVTLAAANSNRKRLVLFNETGTVYIKLGSDASSTDYTYQMSPSSSLMIDFAQDEVVTARRSSNGTSQIQVTSFE